MVDNICLVGKRYLYYNNICQYETLRCRDPADRLLSDEGLPAHVLLSHPLLNTPLMQLWNNCSFSTKSLHISEGKYIE